MKKILLHFLAIGCGLACTATDLSAQSVKVYTNKSSKRIGTYQNITFREGGFSGLFAIPGTNGKEFYTLSDRGLNVDAKNSGCTPTYDKIFPFPGYVPKMHRIRISGDSIQIIQTTTIKRPNGNGSSGLLNPTGFGSTAAETVRKDTSTICTNLSDLIVNKDVWGIDCEGLAVGKNNDYWLCEEGGPSVWHLNANGKVINRYTPYANFPGAESIDLPIDTVFKYRKNNRGFEGLTITPSGKVYAMIQSPILYPTKSDGEKSYVHRLLEIDPATNATRMFAYLNRGVVNSGTDTIKAKDWKIGDLSAISDSTFLVIEQGVAGAFAQRNIYKLNITDATPVTSGRYNNKTLEQLKNLSGLTGAGITPIKKTLFLDLRAAGWPDSLDKAEGLAIINDSTIAVCNDNDFGQKSEKEDGIATATNIKSQLYVFGLTGSAKINNYLAQSQTISNHADSVLLAANAKTDADYSIPSLTSYRFSLARATSVPDSANIAQLENTTSVLQPKETPYSINMAINGDPKTRMGFAWYTNQGIEKGRVQIVAGKNATAADFANPLLTIVADTTCFRSNYNVAANSLSNLAGIADNTKKSYSSHKAVVSGLTPNTAYSFRVGTDGAWSEIGSFTTAKDSKEPFSFIYSTDPQSNTVEMFDISQKTTHAAQNMYPNANFWLSCGDLIETSGNTNSEWEYEQFFQTQQDIFLKNPTAYIVGNHDKSANKNFTRHFNTQPLAFDQSKSITPGSIYSFVYGDALFMALSYEDYSVAGQLDSIAKWMRAQVTANRNTKWRIAFYHKTMYTGSASHQSDADGKAVRERMAPLFDSLKIDLALQGHDHIYEVMGPIKNKQLVTGAVSNQIQVTFDARENVTGILGGTFDVKDGTLYFLNNSAGKKKYEPRSKTQMDGVEASLGLTNYFGMFTGRFGQTGRPTFSNVSVCTDSISIITYEVSDNRVPTLFDRFRVIKTPGGTVTQATETAADNINFYPVPVKNKAFISFKQEVDATVRLYSVSGTLVKTVPVKGNSEIDLSDLHAGSYLLKVTSASGCYTVKFIKDNAN